MSTTQYSDIEPVTSATNLSHQGGEAWIEQEGRRINIPAEHFKTIVKQLQRAHQIAKGNAQ